MSNLPSIAVNHINEITPIVPVHSTFLCPFLSSTFHLAYFHFILTQKASPLKYIYSCSCQLSPQSFTQR